ncbi:hypothetical protein LBMAG21_06240 [Armatimonadota bacterium]|nr:hypothetical protein LBMAG21_06240 [Armatimonadota bacterium]
MAIAIKLQPTQQALLEKEAQKYGLTLEDYASSILNGERPLPDERERKPLVSPQQFKTGADIVAYWKEQDLIGVLYQDTEEDSVVIARRLREAAENRDWKRS